MAEPSDGPTGVPPAERARVGREPGSGLYYEILGERASYPHPVVLIHGGGGTGANYRRTADGRKGWADVLADRGFEVWVTDWPGNGRSGYRDILELEYDDVVDGYRRLLTGVLDTPAVLCCHSMGGAITWKLVEQLPDRVVGVVATASAYPGNLSKPSTVVHDDGDVVELLFADTGVRFQVDRRVPYTYDDAYLLEQAIGESWQFPMEALAATKSGLGCMSPRMLLQRVGVLDGMPVITDPAGFAGKPVRLVTGELDPAHPREIEEGTRDLLRSWGADAELVWLADRGIRGNGHFLAAERNTYEVLQVVEEQLRAVAAARTRA